MITILVTGRLRRCALTALLLIAAGARASDCAPHLSVLGVTGEEARYWSRRPRSRDVFFAISSTLRLADEAPADVWDLLALARLGRLHPLEPFLDELEGLLRGQDGLAELEVLFDTEVGELRDELSAVLALERYGSPAAREWFQRLRRVPVRLFVLARVLAEYPAADYNVVHGFVRLREPKVIKLNLARLRRWKIPDRSWRGLFSSSRLLAANLVDRRFNFYKYEKRAITTDVEHMGEWALDRLAPRAGANANRPEPVPTHWTEFYARLFDAIDTPAFRQTKYQFGLTEGDAILVGLLSGAGHELMRPQVEAYGEQGWTAGRFAAACVAQAYEEEMVNVEGGARALGFLLDAMGFSFPRGPELKLKFARHLAATLGNSLREYYPIAGRGQGELVEPAREPAPTPPGPALGEAFPVPDTPAPKLAHADDLPAFEALEADRVYHVDFRRPHAKFSGTQKVRFTRAALDQILAHAEVEPATWLEALRMGIALPHRQRGVKLLVFGVKRASCGGLPAEIKLLLSNYRVTGDFCDGVWTFTGLAKGH